MRAIGIDPGLTGAMAMVSSNEVIDVIDLPIYEAVDGKMILNTSMLARTLQNWCLSQPYVVVWVEHATMRPDPPRPSIQSVYSIGRMFGAIEGMLAIMGQSVQYVHPSVWKKAHRLNSKGKGASIAAATDIYANASVHLTLKKHHDRAEAMLIAHYGMAAAALATAADAT